MAATVISPEVRRSSRARLAVGTAFATVCACTFVQMSGESVARADEVSPHGKGIVGGGLLGAEVVTGVESIIGVRNPWAYVIGGVVGAGGGAVGGWAVENNSSDGRAPTYLLAGGLALIIPAVVLTLDATRYRPTEDASEDKAPTNGPAADPGKVGGSAVVGVSPTPAAETPVPASGGSTPSSGASGTPSTPSTTPATEPVKPQPAPAPGAPSSMLHFDTTRGEIRFGVPVPEVRPVYTLAEQKAYGVGNASEVRMPLLRVRF